MSLNTWVKTSKATVCKRGEEESAGRVEMSVGGGL